MIELNCSLCPSVVLRCYNLTKLVPWNYLICQNCTMNGYFKQQAKRVLDLVENVIYKQESTLRQSIQREYQGYKKKYYLNNTAVYDALVKQETHTFTQLYIKYIQQVGKEEPKLNKDIQAINEKIHEYIEAEAKRSIIGEVKQLNNALKKEEELHRINVKKVEDEGEKMKNDICSITHQSHQEEENPKHGKRIFDDDEINQFADFFNRKKVKMNKKVNALSELCNQGGKILTYEKPPKKEKQQQDQ